MCCGKVLVTGRDKSQLSSPLEGVNEIKTPCGASSDLNLSLQLEQGERQQDKRKERQRERDGLGRVRGDLF